MEGKMRLKDLVLHQVVNVQCLVESGTEHALLLTTVKFLKISLSRYFERLCAVIILQPHLDLV
jgi:hypothetical protein